MADAECNDFRQNGPNQFTVNRADRHRVSHVVVKWVYFIHVQSMFKIIQNQRCNRKVRRGYSVINSEGGYAPKEHRPTTYVAVDRPAAAGFF
jgi:hypothetical protein